MPFLLESEDNPKNRALSMKSTLSETLKGSHREHPRVNHLGENSESRKELEVYCSGLLNFLLLTLYIYKG